MPRKYPPHRSPPTAGGHAPHAPALPLVPGPLPEESAITGQVLRVVYANPENGYSVVLVRRADGGGEAILAGALAGALPGGDLKAEGTWKTHPRHGRQFVVSSVQFILPTSTLGIQRYLASGCLPGVNEATAKKIVDHFGEKTLEVLDHAPRRLLEVPGIGVKKLEGIREGWENISANRAEEIFLMGHGISPALAQRIISQYDPKKNPRARGSASQIVRQDPYRLARDVEGIGFLTCDRIAASMGITPDSPKRVAAGLDYALRQSTLSGHVFLPMGRLFREAGKLLEVPPEALGQGMEHALSLNLFQALQFPGEEELLCYPAGLAGMEENLARRIHCHLRQTFPPLSRLALPPPPPGGLTLNPQQNQAVKTALVSPLSIITGGPGVGKTTVVRRIVQIAQENHWKICLAAPTGRAAKRLAEATGMKDAATIHRLLKFDPQSRQFTLDEDTPLECDLLVVDEVSMLDLPLANSLLAAVPPQTRLVLVGDRDQLPSVGPGAVLHDLLECGLIPTVALTQIYRQSEGSRIVTSAHEINRGHLPDLTNPPRGVAGEFYFYDFSQPEECQRFVARLCSQSIPGFFGWNPMEDIQVLTPMRKGECGTVTLNRVLQEHLNPPSPEKPELTLAGEDPPRIFRLGDKVMQTKNNYDKQVFNGDMGRIVSLDRKQRTFQVAFDRETVEYTAADCTQLLHAYAVTIHKSQGCEFPAVVVPLLGQHRIMLQRNLLYTAVTRAKRLFILAGDPHAVQQAVANATPMSRNTRLAWRLLHPQERPLLRQALSAPQNPLLPYSLP